MFQILLLPGDGIGPEVMAEAVKVLTWLTENTDLKAQTQTARIGGCALDAEGSPYPASTRTLAHKADAILLGAVGGPKWDGKVPFEKRPEQGLLDLREDLNLFANLRPAKVFDALLDASSLKADVVRGMDVLIVRELIGGVYFGKPRGIEALPTGGRRGYNTTSYSTSEVERIAHVAFKAAAQRRNKVTSIDKANVLESMVVWREAVTNIGKNYTNTQLEHMYVDNAAMQLASRPTQFDVMVAPNLAGDILSDLAAALTGSLGLLPSASLNESAKGVYEPVHGSAPDIAGKGIANPLATILSLAMLLTHSLNRADLGTRIEKAVEATLAQGARTTDLRGTTQPLSTSQMGDAVIANLATC